MRISVGAGWSSCAGVVTTWLRFAIKDLQGAADTVVFDACVGEGRTLVTLDRDFGQILRFPPSRSAGVVILEIGAPPSVDRVVARLRDFLALVEKRPVHGELWIVEPSRVRVHLAKGSE